MFEGYFGRRRLKTLLVSIVISLLVLILISCWRNRLSPSRTRLKFRRQSSANSKFRLNPIPFLPSIGKASTNILSSIEFTNSPYVDLTTTSSILIPIIVLSQASNIEIRDAIRRTWAFKRFFRRQSIEIKVFFLVGIDDQTFKRIRAEQRLFNDVIHVSIPELDSFMAYKELSAMIWIRSHLPRARFYIKTEDTVIMNIRAMIDVLLPSIEKIQHENFLIGWFGSKHLIHRGNYQKFVDAVLSITSIHLDYAMSLFYVVTARAADQMLNILNDVEFLDQPGDPFVTGVLRLAARIQVKNLAIDRLEYRYQLIENSCTTAFTFDKQLLFCSPITNAQSKRSTTIYFETWNTLFNHYELSNKD